MSRIESNMVFYGSNIKVLEKEKVVKNFTSTVENRKYPGKVPILKVILALKRTDCLDKWLS